MVGTYEIEILYRFAFIGILGFGCIASSVFSIFILYVLLFGKQSGVSKELKFKDGVMDVPVSMSRSNFKQYYNKKAKMFISGIKSMPNNLNPKLTLYDTYLEHRYIELIKSSYESIENIEIDDEAEVLTLFFRDNEEVYIFAINNSKNTRMILEFLQKKGCPLSDEANKFLNEKR